MESFWPNIEFHCLHKNLLKIFAFKVLWWTKFLTHTQTSFKIFDFIQFFILKTFYNPTNHFLEARCLLKWFLIFGMCWAFLVAQMVKNLPAMQETWVWSLGWEDPSWGSNGNPFQCSCLENLMDRGAWWAIVHGVAKSQTQLNDLHSLTVKALGKWLYLLAAHLPDEVSSSVSSQGSCSRSRGLLPIPSPHQSQPCPLLPVHKTRSPHRAFPVVSSSCILKSICSAKLGPMLSIQYLCVALSLKGLIQCLSFSSPTNPSPILCF